VDIETEIWLKEELVVTVSSMSREFYKMHKQPTNTLPIYYVFLLMSSTTRFGKYQYSETNVMHFLFNLLRIKGLYMFRALLAHPQEALHKRHLVYCVRVKVSWLHQDSTPVLVQPTDIDGISRLWIFYVL
jgi:hypothetical protein